MNRYSRMCLALAAIVTPALYAAEVPAKDGVGPGEAVNAALPRWLRIGAEARVRMEALEGVGFRDTGNEYLLQRLRLNLDLTPVRWLRFSFQGQDARVHFTDVSPRPSSQHAPADLRAGFVQIGDPESHRVTVRAGRQGLTFGEGRLVADPNWSNVGRSFDGVRLSLHHRKLRLDAFTGATDKIYADGFDTPVPGEHFHAIYGALENLVPLSSIEPYLFWRLEHNVKGERAAAGNLDAKTVGVRWVGKLPRQLDYGVEVAMQRGSQAGEPVAAWAGHWVLGYTLHDRKYRPRLFAELNRASGDGDSHDGIHGVFDSLFPSVHDRLGTADPFTWINLVHARWGLQHKPNARLTMSVAYDSFWRANRADGVYSGGKLLVTAAGLAGSHLAQEADVQGQWSAGRHTTVDFAYGLVLPGEALRRSGRPAPFHCLILGITQKL